MADKDFCDCGRAVLLDTPCGVPCCMDCYIKHDPRMCPKCRAVGCGVDVIDGYPPNPPEVA